MARPLRILILLVILALVAGMTAGERLWVRSWSRPLAVAVYPVAMDAASADYVARLGAEDFREIADYIAAEAQRWQQAGVPAPRIGLKAPIREAPPMAQGRGVLDAVVFSLRLRWYAFRHTPFWDSLGTVRLFVLYHDIEGSAALPHSLGLQKGLLGVVHVFASDAQRAQNNVVITHELLHTLGAKDKYGAGGLPIHPAGYAEPYADPLLPQTRAEIMGGRVPITESRAEIPDSLADTLIGYATAAEIGWSRP